LLEDELIGQQLIEVIDEFGKKTISAQYADFLCCEASCNQEGRQCVEKNFSSTNGTGSFGSA